jgi:sterol desaturase/sphingolipid hydroxylase (fatty acid hydroxylase superfamily)
VEDHSFYGSGFLIYFIVPSLLGVALEILVSGEQQSWTFPPQGLPFWGIYIALGVTIGTTITWLRGCLQIQPLVHLDLRKAAVAQDWPTLLLAFTVFPALGSLVYDFFYWFHRLQHANKTAWRVHSVHHSIEELNACNDYHHWLEDILRIPFILVPMSLLVTIQAPTVVVYSSLLRFAGQMTHANSRISYGTLRCVFAEPRYHRIHRSLEKRHWGKNFAFMFPIWDILFGTSLFSAER